MAMSAVLLIKLARRISHRQLAIGTDWRSQARLLLLKCFNNGAFLPCKLERFHFAGTYCWFGRISTSSTAALTHLWRPIALPLYGRARYGEDITRNLC